MSDTNPAPEPANPEPNEPFSPTLIDPAELHADPAPPVVDPTPEPTPDPNTPDPEPTPEPGPDLAGLFTPDPEPEPVADPNADPEPEPGDVPAMLRSRIKEQKKEYETQIQELRNAVEESKKSLEDTKREMVAQNPLLDDKVVEANKTLEAEIKNIARGIGSPAAARKFLEKARVFADKYSQLGDIYSEGYDERYASLTEEMRSELGDKADHVLSNMPRIETLRTQLEQAVNNAATSGISVNRDKAMSAYSDAQAALKSAVSSTLVYNEELAKVDPYAPQNIVAKMIESIPHFKDVNDSLLDKLEASMVPPKPILPEMAPSMSDQERLQKDAERQAAFRSNYGELQKSIPLAFSALAAVPILTKALADAKSKLSEYVNTQPAPSNNFGNPNPEPANNNPENKPEVGKFAPITREELFSG